MMEFDNQWQDEKMCYKDMKKRLGGLKLIEVVLRRDCVLRLHQWIPDDDEEDSTLFPPCSPVPPALMY